MALMMPSPNSSLHEFLDRRAVYGHHFMQPIDERVVGTTVGSEPL